MEGLSWDLWPSWGWAGLIEQVVLAVGWPRTLCWLCGQRALLGRPGGPKEWSHMCTSGPLGTKLSALECLEGMAAGLYSELFTLLISLVNR